MGCHKAVLGGRDPCGFCLAGRQENVIWEYHMLIERSGKAQAGLLSS